MRTTIIVSAAVLIAAGIAWLIWQRQKVTKPKVSKEVLQSKIAKLQSA